MKPIRAFFALSMPKSIQHLLAEVLISAQKCIPAAAVHWMHRENLHITLQFMPEVHLNDIAQLIEDVRINLTNTPSFYLELKDIEFFPTPTHPRIISLAVGPSDRLIQLSAAIGQGIKTSNYPVETRAFRGHLTLGRLRYVHHQSFSLEQIKIPLIPKIWINEICLFESKPGKEHSNYIPLAHLNLKRAD